MNNKFIVWVLILLAVYGGIGGTVALVGGNQSVTSLAGMTNLDGLTITPVDSGDGFKVGANGGLTQEMRSSTCNLATTVARLPIATTSVPFQCSITGVVTGDQVYVTLPAEGAATGQAGVAVGYAIASSTAGVIEVGLYARPWNSTTGIATSSFAQSTTSVQVWTVDN